MLGFQLFSEAVSLGALNLHSKTPRPVDQESEDVEIGRAHV